MLLAQVVVEHGVSTILMTQQTKAIVEVGVEAGVVHFLADLDPRPFGEATPHLQGACPASDLLSQRVQLLGERKSDGMPTVEGGHEVAVHE